jgi:transcriptional regulator with XRE-family HTH domain
LKKLKYPNIEAERARRGLTVEELAEKLGVSRKTYYNWISKGKIPADKVNMLSEMFFVSSDYLLGVA